MALFDVDKGEAYPVFTFIRKPQCDNSENCYDLPVKLVEEYRKLDRQLNKVQDQLQKIMDAQDRAWGGK